MIRRLLPETFYHKLYERFDFGSTGRLILCSAVVGFVSGLFVVVFLSVCHFVEEEVLGVYGFAGIHWIDPDQQEETGEKKEDRNLNPFIAPGSSRDSFFGLYEYPRYGVIIILIPAIGGLICGLLIWTFAPEAEGGGVDPLLKAYHYRNGMLRFRCAPTKALATLTTLGSGGSGGYEGPIAMIGGAIGSLFARNLKIDARERRILLLAGAAAGFGAIFQTPFGGALFAAEVLYFTACIEFSVLLPCIVASLIGCATSSLFLSEFRPVVLPESFGSSIVNDVFWAVPFVFLCAGVGWLFVKSIHETRNRFFSRIEIPEWLKPALGGLMVGCVALFISPVRGTGFEYYQSVFDGSFSLVVLIALIFGKIFATSFTVSSGGSAGLIAPSLFIGALTGYAFGLFAQLLCQAIGVPGLAPSPLVLMVLGMGTLLGGVGKIPLTATVMVCDMVGSYDLFVLLLLMNFLQLAIHSPRTRLFSEQLMAKEDSPVHLGDFSTDLLEQMRIDESIDKNTQGHQPLIIPAQTTLSKMMQLIAGNSASLFPVVDANGTLLGCVFASDVRSAFQNHGPEKKMKAADLAMRYDIFLTQKDHYLAALRTMVRFSIDEIPVVDFEDRNRVLYLLRKEDILLTYHHRLASSSAEPDPDE